MAATNWCCRKTETRTRQNKRNKNLDQHTIHFTNGEAKATFWCWTLLITTCLSFMTQYSPNERLNWIQFWQQCKTARIKWNWVHRQCFQCSAASSVWSIFITLHNGLAVANDFQNIFKIQSLTWNTTTDRLCAEHMIHVGLLLYIQIDEHFNVRNTHKMPF